MGTPLEAANDGPGVRRSMAALGVGVLEPVSSREESLARALEDFATFCLHVEAEQCKELIHRHLDGTAGVLQGGSCEHEIYRLVLVPNGDDSGNNNKDDETTTRTAAAGNDLLRLFVTSPAGKRHRQVLTVAKLQAYMLGMCHRFDPTARYTQLGNLMWILSFGPVPGQVRHIDDMDPNAQICLYMSPDCPSTVVFDNGMMNDDDDDDDDNCYNEEAQEGEDDYSTEPPRRILNQKDLVRYWQVTTSGQIPDFLVHLLETNGNVLLASKRHTKYFGTTWPTINATLRSFGQLYLPVQRRLALSATMPGTTLIAARNQVHAGPPTAGPRMFAFAIGIPEDGGANHDDNGDNLEQEGDAQQHLRCANQEENNGEVQYNPVLFHLDLTCILFSLMDFETQLGQSDEDESTFQAKSFLLHRLVELIRDHDGKFYGQSHWDTYDRLLGDDRSSLRQWLQNLVRYCMTNGDETASSSLIRQTLLTGDASIFYSPDMVHSKRKQRGKRNNMRK